MDTLIISLVSIFAGWVLAQFTGIIKEYLYRRKIKISLLEELQEIKIELERTILIYARQLQINALKGIDNNSPIRLSHHIFNRVKMVFSPYFGVRSLILELLMNR